LQDAIELVDHLLSLVDQLGVSRAGRIVDIGVEQIATVAVVVAAVVFFIRV
jgi:hypothetical protein